MIARQPPHYLFTASSLLVFGSSRVILREILGRGDSWTGGSVHIRVIQGGAKQFSVLRSSRAFSTFVLQRQWQQLEFFWDLDDSCQECFRLIFHRFKGGHGAILFHDLKDNHGFKLPLYYNSPSVDPGFPVEFLSLLFHSRSLSLFLSLSLEKELDYELTPNLCPITLLKRTPRGNLACERRRRLMLGMTKKMHFSTLESISDLITRCLNGISRCP